MQLELNTNPQDSASTLFIDVVLPLRVHNLFTYRVPRDMEEEVAVGKRVMVQFGKKKVYTAIVVKLHKTPPKDYTAKYILDVPDEKPVIHPVQLTFWQWMANYYCCTMGEVMDSALPANMKLESETRILADPSFEGELSLLDDRQYMIAEALQVQQELTLEQVSDILGIKNVMKVVHELLGLGVITLKEHLKKGYKPKTITCVRLAPVLADEAALKEAYAQLERAPKQLDILLHLVMLQRQEQHVPKPLLLERSGASDSSLKGLEEKGILQTYQHEVGRIEEQDVEQAKFELAPFQQQALEEVKKNFTEKQTVLLQGITGSGKTHIYIRLMEEVLQQGKQALYMVPEIALTAQLIRRLKSTFGDKIGIYHSKISDNERIELWYKLLKGEYQAVLGVRSSLFLPFSNLGLVVVDEEHENTYKQSEPNPRYHARDAAIYLASLFKAKVILGTATPGFESYFNAEKGKYGLVKLSARYTNIELPEIILSDLREEHKHRSMQSHFSSLLMRHIKATLQAKKQVILFQNRRGFSPYLECQTCGQIPQCTNCDISLTYHKGINTLKCHYCGYSKDVPVKCPACGNTTIRMKGFGTEKLEDELKILFPEEKVLRLDQDATRKKDSYIKIIGAFERGEASILVGTQMVTKGLDFENVQLVGIMNADQMLGFPDFRANERSYQLMSQVSGRAGRRQQKGKVVIQTFHVQHPIFQFIIHNTYERFYEYEMQQRIAFNYPPLHKLIKLTLRHKEIEQVKKSAGHLGNMLRNHFGSRVLGPEFPPVIRIRNRYIMNIMLKFNRKENMKTAKQLLLQEAEAFTAHPHHKTVRLIIDVDPM